MDALPPEMLLNILRYLPGTDILRMKRVNRMCDFLIATNKKEFLRPTISIKLDQNSRFFGNNNAILAYSGRCRYIMTIKTHKNRHAAFTICVKTAQIAPVRNNTTAEVFLTSFIEYGGQLNEDGGADIHRFMQWLLGECDVDKLYIRRWNGVTHQFEWVVNAIMVSKCRCKSLVMDSMICYYRFKNYAYGGFLGGITYSQELLGKPIDIRIRCDQIFFPQFIGLEEFNLLHPYFANIVVELPYKDIITIIYSAARGWMAHEFEVAHYVIRLRKGNPCFLKYAEGFLTQIMGLEMSFLNITFDELAALPYADREKLPTMIEAKKHMTGEIMKIKIDQTPHEITVSFDFSKPN